MQKIPTQSYRQLLIHYLKPHWRGLLLLELILLASIALRLLNPQVLRYFIDTALAGGAPHATLTLTALAYIGIALATQGLTIALTYLGEKIGWSTTNAMRAGLMRHCLHLDMTFHKSHTPGTFIERIDGDITALANFFSQFLVRIVGNILLIAGVLFLLLQEDWRVGLAVGLAAAINLVVLSRLRNFAVPHWQKARQASANLFGFLEEYMAGTEDIQANGGKAYALSRLHPLSRAVYHTYRRARLANALLFAITSSLFFLGDAVGIGAGVYLAMQDIITVGTVYLIYNYGGILFKPLDEIQEQVQDLQKAVASMARIRELFRQQSHIHDNGRQRLPTGPLAVRFDDVSFGYDGPHSKVLHHIDFQLPAGKVLGLLGRTGSGKTTLTRLLFHLYDATEGDVRLNGLSLPAARLNEVRRCVGMVTQEVELFQASVRDNITFFDERISDERILDVLYQLGLGTWYETLGDGLDTQLRAGNGSLSAGEAQLLAFARIFLQDPGLVILDEPSSRLDPATEQLLERAVDRLLHERTGIIIAHRLATLQRADEIMLLENGRVLEYGPRIVLANDPESRFYQLLNTGAQEVLA